MYRSRNTSGRPKYACASRVARASALSSSSGLRTTCMPLPPPPNAALTMRGNPMRSASAGARSRVTGSGVPGTMGTPTRSAARRAADLSPIISIASAGGPMNVKPESATALAKCARSDRNP